MANNFKDYDYFVNNFNKKYGTNFSLEEYDKEQRRFDNFSENFLNGPVNGVSNEDNVYRKEFLKRSLYGAPRRGRPDGSGGADQ